jgi:hypothetical protein
MTAAFAAAPYFWLTMLALAALTTLLARATEWDPYALREDETWPFGRPSAHWSATGQSHTGPVAACEHCAEVTE